MPHPEHERAELVQLRIVVIRMELSPEPCGIDLASRCVQEFVTHRYRRWPTTGAQVAAVRSVPFRLWDSWGIGRRVAELRVSMGLAEALDWPG